MTDDTHISGRTAVRCALLIVVLLASRHLSASSDWILVPLGAGRPVISPVFRVVADLICACIAFLALINGKVRMPVSCIALLSAPVGIGILSTFLSHDLGAGSDAIVTLSSLRATMLFCFTLVIGARYSRAITVLSYARALVIIGFAQIPLCYAQQLLTGRGDYVTGLMGEYGSGTLGLYQIMASLIFIEKRMLHHNSVTVTLIGVIVLLSPLPFAESVLPMLLAPPFILAMTVLLWVNGVPLHRLGAILVVTLAVALYAASIYAGLFGHATGQMGYFLKTDLAQRVRVGRMENEEATRLGFLTKVLDTMGTQPQWLLWGYGLGEAASSRASQRVIAERFMRVSKGTETWLTDRLLETGFVGTILSYCFLLVVLRRALLYLCERHAFQEVHLRGSVFLCTILCIIATFYNKSVYSFALNWAIVPIWGFLIVQPFQMQHWRDPHKLTTERHT